MDYSRREFWEERYTAGSSEWYFSLEVLRPVLEKAAGLTQASDALEIGCGDAPLLSVRIAFMLYLYDSGVSFTH